MDASSTSVAISAKRRTQSVESALAIIRDLHALQARGLTTEMTRKLGDRGQEDCDVLQNQQLYCRYARDSSKPVSSWRSQSAASRQPWCPAEPSRQPASGQQSALRLPSPFQAAAADSTPQTTMAPQTASTETSNEPPSWAHTMPAASIDCDLPASLTHESCLEDPRLSVLSSTADHILDSSLANDTLDRHISAPVGNMSPDPFALVLNTAHSLASDTISFQTSPSMPLLDLPTTPAASAMMDLHNAPEPSEVKLQLVSAPAAFGQPIGINKAVSPPFQARVELRSHAPTQLNVKLVAYLITPDQLQNLSQWDPNAHVVSEHILGGVLEHTVLCDSLQETTADGKHLFKGSYNMVFRDMKFATASRMRPRWLVLAMMVGQDAVFLHYKVPTIVMSRTCDQSSKAAAILRGELHSKKRSRSTDPDESQLSQCHLYEQPAQQTAPALLPPPQPVMALAPQGLPQTAFPGLSQTAPQPLCQPAQSSETRSGSMSMSHMSHRSDSAFKAQSSGLEHVQAVQPASAPKPASFPPPNDMVNLNQSVRSASLPSCAQGLEKPSPRLRGMTHPMADPQISTGDPKQMVASFLSHGERLPSPGMPQILEPMSPASAMMASLLIPESPVAGTDAPMLQPSPMTSSLLLPGSPLVDLDEPPNSQLKPALKPQHSPDSVLSRRSSYTRTSSHTRSRSDPQDHWAHQHDSMMSQPQQPAQDSMLSQPQQTFNTDFDLDESDLAMLSEAVGTAGAQQVPNSNSDLNSFGSQGLNCADLAQGNRQKSWIDPRIRHNGLGSLSFGPSVSSSPISVKSETLRWPAGGPYNIQRWQAVLMQLYQACNLGRPLTNQDVRVLGQVAGFHSDPILIDTDCLSEQQWYDFGQWFISQLRLLRCHQQLWDRQDPVLLCSFEVDRVQCEHLLFGQAPGTFLIRPSISLTGCMVVSTVADNGTVKHLCLDSKQLYARSLEVWVRDAVEARYFLDYRTGLVWQKEQVFLMQYRRFGVAADLQQPLFQETDATGQPSLSCNSNFSPV